ncbi:MAG: Ni/Fe-hydrogenase cytochrome b subunit [Proteobacteria bacterium]|nr:Ni/Fe-hydrogenase cytochrome b subunit [Pseudomonadota bacterium]MBU1688743.1 Ni/Fe-hydrogenase cytochrome b subunit [Pseudomonadota bacterium]
MKPGHEIKLWTLNTTCLVIFIIVGIIGMGYRLIHGLGAVTNLNDLYPWGFWLGFDVLGGVAMAAGGFIIACAVYIFNWEKYKPISRPAILTAFLGYLMAVVALFLDIGHPFRLWHPTIMWQVHSVMWVVAIHVILYTTTLAIESSPMLLEKTGMKTTLKLVNKIMIGAVIFGVMLSTLHQASLGAVFLIAPSKMSPLWYTHFLPYMFLISAVAMGMAMVSTEAMLSAKAFNHKIDREIFSGLALGTFRTLALYLALKVFFLLKNAGLAPLMDNTLESGMYLFEVILGIVAPLLLLANKKGRTDLSNIMLANTLVIAGVLINRLNVCLFSMDQYAVTKGYGYFPSIMELLITLGVVSLGIFIFKLAARYLPLFAKV